MKQQASTLTLQRLTLLVLLCGGFLAGLAAWKLRQAGAANRNQKTRTESSTTHKSAPPLALVPLPAGQALTSLGVMAAPMASFTVDRLTDANPGSGQGSGSAGDLRYCLMQANAASGPDTINFSVTGTINLAGPLPGINGGLTINGPGANQLTVRRNSGGSYRIFNIPNPGQGVSISGLTLSDGAANDFGGGVYSLSPLTLTDCVIANNQSGTGGGGVFLAFANGTFTGCTFSGNSSAQGGAIQFQGSGNTLTLTNCTVNGNSATTNGGGAGILNVSESGSSALQLTNCTVADNAPSVPFVGGVASRAINGNLQPVTTLLRNTILANNSVPSLAPGASGGTFTSQGNNLASDNGNNQLNGAGDLINANPLLGALAANGGATTTRALLPGSPAINAGTAASAPTGDQRGIGRVGNVDIGAFESRGFTLAIAGGNNQLIGVNAAFPNPLAVTVSSSFSEPVTGGQISFTAPGSGASATISGSPATINGSAQASVTATANGQAGGYQVAATANGAASGVNFNLTNFACPAITVTPDTLPQGTAGATYNQSVVASGGTEPYQFSATGLPMGLTMAASGTITGTPTQTGDFTVNVTVTDHNGCPGSGSLTLNIVCPAIGVTPATLPQGTTNTSYNQSVTATGGTAPYQFSATGLPMGLTMAASGAITGAPTESGSFTVAVSVTDHNGCTGGGNVTLLVVCAATPTFTVNDSGDAPDATPNGVCATAGNKCTLRAALEEANASTCPLTINFSVTGTINLTGPLPDIARSLTINGPGANQLTVRRSTGGDYRIFTVLNNLTVTISGLTVTNGSQGGIYSAGTLSVDRAEITGNGGVGIASDGNLTITNSAVTNNNNDTGAGGGVYATGILTIANCTLSGNTGTGAVYAPSATITLTNSTFTDNNIGGSATFILGSGTVTMKNNIFTASIFVLQQCGIGGTLLSEGGNFSNDNSCALTHPTDHVNRTIPLAPLGYYGGSTHVYALLPGSPAINAGVAAGAPPTDQRGIARVGAVDSGAFESRGFTLAITNGNGQSASIGSPFPNPLAVSVTANGAGEPVEGGQVTFTPPSSGASAKLASDNVTIGPSPQVSTIATANLSLGSYQVAASTTGGNTVNFNLSNFCVTSSPVVTNTNDSGPGSLRKALDDACVGALVAFAPGATGTITLTGGELVITRPLTVQGPGASVLTVSGNNQSRVFRIVEDNLNVTLAGLTIANGYLKTADVTINGRYVAAEDAYGGGIYNQSSGTVSVLNCVLNGNRAQGGNATGINSENVAAGVGYGGAIYHGNNNGTLNITGCSLSNNQTLTGAASGGFLNFVFPSRGGAIFSGLYSTMNISRSTLSGNSSKQGAGLYSSGALSIKDSAISGNQGGDWGGGAYVSTASEAILTNTTISGNTVGDGGLGAGIAAAASLGAVVVLTNCTITDNHGGQYSYGGGLYGTFNPFTHIKNTVIAGNTADQGPDVYRLAHSLGNNLIGNGDSIQNIAAGGGVPYSSGVANGVNGDQVGTTAAPLDPKLAPLADNGGPTKTHRLLPDSSAIDKGGAVTPPLTTDQRGQARPNDFASVPNAGGGDGSDIGAFELDCSSLTLSALPGGTAGVAYSQMITASGGAEPYTLTFAGGTLPPGLIFNGNTLSGTPTQAGTFSFTIGVGDGFGCSNSRAYSLTFGCPAIAITTAALPQASAGASYNQTITASPGGLAYSFAVTQGSLPPGLTLANDGALTGTPAQTGFFNFTITASVFGGCAGSRSYSLQVIGCITTVTVTPATLPGGAIGAAYNQMLGASPAGAYNFMVTSGALPPGLSLTAGNGLLSGLPTATGTFSFTVTANSAAGCSGARNYTIAIACPALALNPETLPGGTAGAAYNQSLSVTPAGGSYSYSLVSGSLPSGFILNAATGTLSGISNATGTFNFTLRAMAANGCGATRAYSLTVSCPSVAIAPATLPDGSMGAAYSQNISATPAGNYNFTASGALPPGLNLNPATGLLSGSPTTNGTFNFTITATNANGCAGSKAYSITVSGGSCTSITLPALPNGAPGQLYNSSVAASPGGSYSYVVTSGSLPPGLTFYGAFGLLFGYPTTPGAYSFSITATNANNCTGSKSYSLVISGAGFVASVFGDFDGDGKADFSVWRGKQGAGLIVNSGDGREQTESLGISDPSGNDVPVAGDYDGDSKMDLAVFRRSTGEWLIKSSQDGAVRSEAWGLATDTPVPGDYDGDGKTDLAVWRGAETNWYIRRSSDQQIQTVSWGTSNAPYRDLPVPADYDGDGKTDIAVFRQMNGHWYIKLSSDGSTLDKAWGLGSDVPVAADYDGDGKADIAVWRGTDTNWYILQSSDNAVKAVSWGTSSLGDLPAPADYDGDGKTDAAIWRASSGVWFVKGSRDDQVLTRAQGQLDDRPFSARQP